MMLHFLDSSRINGLLPLLRKLLGGGGGALIVFFPFKYSYSI